MNRNRVISMADVESCSAVSVAFYARYRGKIAEVENVDQRNNILSEMQQDFETEIRQEPQNRNQLSEIYELLKQKCWEIGLYDNR